MFRLLSRGSIAGTVVVVALLSSKSARAQYFPGAPREPGGLINEIATGVLYDRLNQEKAGQRLQKVSERYLRDAERGDGPAMEYDAWRARVLEHRIIVDEWLIRKNSLCPPGYYPWPLCPDPTSVCAVADAARPAPSFYYQKLPPYVNPYPLPKLNLGTMTANPTVPITIANVDKTSPISFALDGVNHQAVADSRRDFFVNPDSIITYDAGGTLGPKRYQLSAGVYEFRSTPEGWVLYKLP